MAKELSVLQQQAEAIKTEVNKGANTSSRIGGMFGDILEYNEGKFTELDSRIYTNTITVNSGSTTRFFNLIPYRGETIAIKADGNFTFIGYYKEGGSYKELSTKSNTWVNFDVPEDATDLYIFNNKEVGETTIDTNIKPLYAILAENAEKISSENRELITNIGYLDFTNETIKNNNNFRFNIELYRGKTIKAKVDGIFTQFGYFKTDSSYQVVSKNANQWVEFNVPDNVTDFFVNNGTGEEQTINISLRTNLAKDVEDLKKSTKGCVFMSLGDSITTESYYIPKLRQILQPSKYYNLAVASATWADRSNTTNYDGNPQFQGDQSQNVLGNQVQKIINNPEIYDVAPDIIIISASTNDGTPISSDKTDYEMRVEIDSHFNENQTTPIQVTEPTFDDSDTYKEHRRTIAGAMRYCVLKLQSMYPDARIYILTPIQGSYNPNKDYVTAQEVKQRYLTEVAKHLAVPVIHVGEECGINRDFEYGGTYWNEEWATSGHPKNGRDLIDGLHPNESGSWKMAKYIARNIINDFVE